MTGFVKAVVVSLKTADGMMPFEPHVKLGDTYFVDVNSRRVVNLFNIQFNVVHAKEVFAADNGRWLPTELLRVVTH